MPSADVSYGFLACPQELPRQLGILEALVNTRVQQMIEELLDHWACHFDSSESEGLSDALRAGLVSLMPKSSWNVVQGSLFRALKGARRLEAVFGSFEAAETPECVIQVKTLVDALLTA